ncbi:MAG: hypothetical protein ABJK59_11715 [Erythrobacter sp.]|uniref:hypothetical protein n=1 Tax=Erythrobacter sp. TaxID=1042 RepID=UPI003297F29E
MQAAGVGFTDNYQYVCAQFCCDNQENKKHMSLRRTKFPDRFAILPSESYRFGPEQASSTRFEIMAQTNLPDGARVLAINEGLIALDFTNSPELGDITVSRFEGSGEVPQKAMEDQERALEIQGSRMRLATYVTACVFGAHAYSTNSTISNALFPGLHEIFAWVEPMPGAFGIPAPDTHTLASRLKHRTARPEFIPTDHIRMGFDLATRLLTARPTYSVADPTSLIVMTYQAMILHNRQHSGASIALSALVAEAALEELVFACGLVDGFPARLSVAGTVTPMSKRAVGSLKLKGRIEALSQVNALNDYLVLRLEKLRNARNVLMHEGQDATPRQAGEGLTAVRDLLRICTGESEYELNMGWSYRY